MKSIQRHETAIKSVKEIETEIENETEIEIEKDEYHRQLVAIETVDQDPEIEIEGEHHQDTEHRQEIVAVHHHENEMMTENAMIAVIETDDAIETIPVRINRQNAALQRQKKASHQMEPINNRLLKLKKNPRKCQSKKSKHPKMEIIMAMAKQIAPLLQHLRHPLHRHHHLVPSMRMKKNQILALRPKKKKLSQHLKLRVKKASQLVVIADRVVAMMKRRM